MKDLAELLAAGVEILREHKRNQKVVNTWFYVQEQKMRLIGELRAEGVCVESPAGQAELLCRLAAEIPVELPPGSVFAGTQDVAFSPSYALINPAFKVESFGGYCDPCAIYDDVVVEGELTAERVARVREFYENDAYTRELYAHYRQFETDTCEVAYFMEPVTGHTIPDLRPFLAEGAAAKRHQALASGTEYGRAMARSLEAPGILARRYAELARKRAAETLDADEEARLTALAGRLERVPEQGARNLGEAIQSFILFWELMVLEQAPNPYAFSAGNLDRVLAPYYHEESFEAAVAMFRHLLAFYIVGSRGWAISQNLLVGGRDEQGNDLTTPMTAVVLEAFFRSNDPQPALSAKIHAGTPDSFFDNLGRFFFTPGHSTPSLFNDDSLLPLLERNGVSAKDAPDYAIAGCQEPLIMGKSSLNTTNTWLNLGKILELALNDGCSTLSGKRMAPGWAELGLTGGEEEVYADPERAFFLYLDYFLPRMAAAGNGCTELLGRLRPVPLTSSLHDSFRSFRDLRDPAEPGVRYRGSGCLIHGLSVVTDSLNALRAMRETGRWSFAELRRALAANFEGYEALREFLESVEKYGNNLPAIDAVAVRLVDEVSRRVSALRNPAGSPFYADWSTPSTHLLYGYWVGATPDGRLAREMLGYGVDPRPEATRSELPERMLSIRRLPFYRMTGGYASHIGIPCAGQTPEEAGKWMRDRIIRPLFAGCNRGTEAPYYVYFNLDSAAHLRLILSNPKQYVPSGIYIMRIHGTFVNFLDLSPAIQEDIIRRLEAGRNVA